MLELTKIECVLTEGSSYSIGVSVTVGGSLGLDFGGIVSAGVDASVTKESVTETAQGSEVKCPEGKWTCSLKITPDVVRVKGKKLQYDTKACSWPKDGDAFDISLPKMVGKMLSTKIEPCACKDYSHWADKGAPPLCPEPCT